MTETESIRLMSLDDWFLHGEELFQRHHAEVGERELQVNIPLLRALAQAGTLEVLAVFHDDALVGYCALVTGPHPHEACDVTTAIALYVAPEHRAGHTGVKLMQAAMDHAKAKGANFLYWQSRCGSSLDQVLQRFRCTEHLENVHRTKV